MPIYEYKCLECGTRVEKRQSISEDPLTKCENCGGKLEKQISLSGFQFKGAGWYVTDYAAKKGTSAERAGDKGDSVAKTDSGEKAEKSSGSESTAKPEAASKPKSDAPAASTSVPSKSKE